MKNYETRVVALKNACRSFWPIKMSVVNTAATFGLFPTPNLKKEKIQLEKVSHIFLKNILFFILLWNFLNLKIVHISPKKVFFYISEWHFPAPNLNRKK